MNFPGHSYRNRATVIVLATLLGVCSIQAASPDSESSSAADALSAESIVAPLHQRFAESDVADVPDFQKHIVPLLGRLGCNGRACHGSFQGRGGFQLSLFGYDFKADHQALLDPDTGRVDLDDINESLILAKPSDADAHEGGKRFELGSWQHHVLQRWIEAGAKFKPGQLQTLQRLEVIPDEIVFSAEDSHLDVQVIAHWEDGTAEEVTRLSRFHSNNDAIATIDDQGRVTAAERGDTYVVVSYDNAVVPVPVIRPFDGTLPSHVESGKVTASDHPIDQLVQNKLDKLHITPSSRCSDADFIRRVSLDMTGVLPSSQSVREFLADSSPNKRSDLIERLLGSPGYAAWWATRMSDWTGNNAEQLNNVMPVRNAAGRLWYEWLRTRIEDNMPYDDIVEGIVTAQSRQPDESYLDYCKAMTEACKPGNEDQFAARDGLPMYWSRRDFQKPEDRAIGFAYTFLGVRIECAQCHKHPFDRWSKTDFESFARLFTPIRAGANSVAPESKENRQQLIDAITKGEELKGGKLRQTIYAAAREGQVVPFAELLVNTRAIQARAKKAAKKRGAKAPMRIPSGKILGELTKLSLNADTRPALMEWLRSPDNPYFAKAIVNRVWGNYFGAGIVDPTDDMNLANPPSNAELLDYLAGEFIANGYDLKWLHRTIATSETYQRSTESNPSNIADRVNYSRHVSRRLPAEVIHDAAVLATGSDQQADRLRDQLNQLAIANGKARGRNRNDFALTVFGQSIRESNCDCDRSDNPSLLQAIYLRNDQDMHARLTASDGWVAAACAALGADGPKPRGNVNRGNAGKQQRAKAIRNRFIARVQKFKNRPGEQRARQLPQLRQDYKKVAKQLKQLGSPLPPLKQMLQGGLATSETKPSAVTSTESESAKPEWTVEKVVEEAYLRTLSRFPNRDETRIAVTYIDDSNTAADGIESLLWALVNTKEFIITH